MMKFFKSLFSTTEAQQNKSTPQYRYRPADDGISYKASQHSDIVSKALDKHTEQHSEYNRTVAEVQKINELRKSKKLNPLSYLDVPPFQLYANFYGRISSAQAAIDKIADMVAGCRWEAQDINGHPNHYLTEELWIQQGLNEIVKKTALQLLVYGNSFIVNQDGTIIQPPPSELNTFLASEKDYEIKHFIWSPNEFSTREYTQDPKKSVFFHSRLSDVDSLVFGKTKFRALITELDTISVDNEGVLAFLREGNFNQVMVLVPENDDGIIQTVSGVLRSNKDRRLRSSPSIIPGGLTTEYNPSFQIQSIKQDPQTRLELSERVEIDGKVYDAFGIPRQLMSGSNSGRAFSANEFEPAMQLFVMQTINPLARHILQDIKAFVLPILLEKLKSVKYFETKEFNINLNDTNRVATAEDFTLNIYPIETEVASNKRKSYIDGFRESIFTAKEVKMRGFDFTELDVADDDGYRVLPTNLQVVKEGKLQEGSGEGTQDLNREDIADEQTEAVEVNNPTKEVETAKSKNAKIRKEQKKIISTFGNHETSQIEKALDANRAKSVKRNLEDKLKNQYSVVETILNRINESGES